MPRGLPDGLEIARVDEPVPTKQADATETIERSLPVGTVILAGLASLIFPLIVYICPKLRKSDTIPLHQGYAAVPRSEVIGHGVAFPHGAPLTNSTRPAQETQFFYIGENENTENDAEFQVTGNGTEAPTESEPEAELCPDSNVPSPSHTAQITLTVPAPVMLSTPQPVQPASHSVLPEAFHEDPKSTRCRMLMLYASPLCQIDARRGPVPLPALCFEKEWKTVLKASAEAHCGPSSFAARSLTSGQWATT